MDNRGGFFYLISENCGQALINMLIGKTYISYSITELIYALLNNSRTSLEGWQIS